jgi:hypothetical protein
MHSVHACLLLSIIKARIFQNIDLKSKNICDFQTKYEIYPTTSSSHLAHYVYLQQNSLEYSLHEQFRVVSKNYLKETHISSAFQLDLFCYKNLFSKS